MPEVKFNFGEWDVESLRVSLFSPVGSPTSAKPELWEKVTGEEPDSIDTRPRERVTRALGHVEQNNLQLLVREERLDWIIQPNIDSHMPTDPVPTLKDTQDTLQILQKATRCSLETISIVQRFAFSPVLIKHVPDPTAGIAQLSRYLPRLNTDSMEGLDFIYQTNVRQRSTSVPHVRINRLSKWSIVQVGTLELKIRASERPHVNTPSVRYARMLNLDVNSDPTTGAMSNDKIPRLFDELVVLANQVATKGDIS